MIKHIYNILIFNIIFGLIGCTSAPSNVHTFTVIASLPTITLTSIEVKSLSSSTPTTTITPKPYITLKPYYTPTPLPTFLPTLELAKARSTILGLYKNNGNCQLPCWWGIYPEKTSIEEVNNILSPLAERYIEIQKNDRGIIYYYSFMVPHYIIPLDGKINSIIIGNYNLVTGIVTDARSVMPSFDFSLAGLLNYFGQPKEIRIDFMPVHGYGKYYTILLFYPDKGVIIGIYGITSEKNGVFYICPQRQIPYTPWLILWSPEEKTTFDTVGSDIFMDLFQLIAKNARKGLRPLETVAPDFNASIFYETYQKSSTKCIAIKGE